MFRSKLGLFSNPVNYKQCALTGACLAAVSYGLFGYSDTHNDSEQRSFILLCGPGFDAFDNKLVSKFHERLEQANAKVTVVGDGERSILKKDIVSLKRALSSQNVSELILIMHGSKFLSTHLLIMNDGKGDIDNLSIDKFLHEIRPCLHQPIHILSTACYGGVIQDNLISALPAGSTYVGLSDQLNLIADFEQLIESLTTPSSMRELTNDHLLTRYLATSLTQKKAPVKCDSPGSCYQLNEILAKHIGKPFTASEQSDVKNSLSTLVNTRQLSSIICSIESAKTIDELDDNDYGLAMAVSYSASNRM